jgi:hypothetical protein
LHRPHPYTGFDQVKLWVVPTGGRRVSAHLGVVVSIVALSFFLPEASATVFAASSGPTPPTVTSTLGGYVASGKGVASLSFPVPKLSCPDTAIGTFNIGLAVADIGGNGSEAAVSMTCQKPAPPTLVAQIVSFCTGKATKTRLFPVKAGDKITVTTGPTGAATLNDLTRNATQTVAGCTIKMSKAIYGMFCPLEWTIPFPPPTGTPACTVLAGFPKEPFSGATLSGKAIGKLKPTAFSLVVSPHSVTPGKFGSKGDTFGETYK